MILVFLLTSHVLDLLIWNYSNPFSRKNVLDKDISEISLVLKSTESLRMFTSTSSIRL